MEKSKYICPDLVVVEIMEEDMIAQSPGNGSISTNVGIGSDGENPTPGTDADVKFQGVMDSDLW